MKVVNILSIDKQYLLTDSFRDQFYLSDNDCDYFNSQLHIVDGEQTLNYNFVKSMTALAYIVYTEQL